MSVNKVILVGNLGKDPEMRVTQSQMAVCGFSLATTDRRKDASGQWVDQTEWHKISTFGKVAENCGKYLKKGSQVFIEGQIRTSKWQDKEGKDRYSTEIIGNSVQFLGKKDSAGGSSYSGSSSSEGEPNFSSPEEVQNAKNVFGSLKSADAISTPAAVGGAMAANGGALPFDDDDIPF